MFKNAFVKVAIAVTVLGSALVSTSGVAAASPAQDYKTEMKPLVVDAQEWVYAMKAQLKIAEIKPELACDGTMGDLFLISINMQGDLGRLYKTVPASMREDHDEMLASMGDATLAADGVCSGDATAIARANNNLRSLNSAAYKLGRLLGVAVKAR